MSPLLAWIVTDGARSRVFHHAPAAAPPEEWGAEARDGDVSAAEEALSEQRDHEDGDGFPQRPSMFVGEIR